MAWEFVAIAREHEEEFFWRWRRIADDAALLLEESMEFRDLQSCIDDARKHGFSDVTDGPDRI